MQAEVGNFYIRDETLRNLAEDVVAGLSNVGFRLIVLNSGHYPAYQGKLLKQFVTGIRPRYEARVIAFDESDAGLKIDHAGIYETAMYMPLCGNARLDRVTDDQKNKVGYWSEDRPPAAATKEFGLDCMKKIEAYREKVIREVLVAE